MDEYKQLCKVCNKIKLSSNFVKPTKANGAIKKECNECRKLRFKKYADTKKNKKLL